MTYRIDYPCNDPDTDLIKLELAGYPNAVFSENIVSVYIEDLESANKIPLKGQGQIQVVTPAQWQNNWLNDYQGYEIDHQLIIIPETDNRKHSHQFQLRIDPSDAFGDGHHPTSQMTLKLLKNILTTARDPEKLSVLDIGCGTGLSAILAAKIGVKNVQAFDISDKAVLQSINNFKLNNLKGKVFQADISSFDTEEKYDLVAANLLTAVIFDNLPKLISLLTDQGKLLVSGIGEQWTREAFVKFEEHKLKVSRHIQQQGWNCFLLVNKDS